MDPQPQLFILSGPNGAGKTTTARDLLPRTLGLKQFVNADSIAEGLSPFAPETTAFQAGRLMLRRIEELMMAKKNFAFETTLAGHRTPALLQRAQTGGYFVNLIYIWLSSPELAIRRVADRVRQGGHFVPEADIRRRYTRGLENFFQACLPLANTWTLCDNSGPELHIVAQGSGLGKFTVYDQERLNRIQEMGKHARVNTQF